MNTYLFTYDASVLSSQDALDAFISGSKYISSWSFLFPGAFLLKSDNEIDDFIVNFVNFLGKVRFVFVKIGGDGNEVVNGKIAPEIWRWLTGLSEDAYSVAVKAYKRKIGVIE